MIGFTIASCGSDETSLTVADVQNPTTPLEKAHAIVPFGTPQNDIVPFPDEMMLSFLNCVEDTTGEEVVVLAVGGDVSDARQVDLFANQQIAASDCAFANGLDEFAPMWTPPSRSELDSMLDRWLAAVDLCFDNVGIEEYPTYEVEGGIPEPDFAGAIAQDPSIEEPLRACMREQGEEFPGDE